MDVYFLSKLMELLLEVLCDSQVKLRRVPLGSCVKSFSFSFPKAVRAAPPPYHLYTPECGAALLPPPT